MWSIGIYTGDSPYELSQPERVTNPVLTAASVTDIPASFVADPFMLRGQLFFEVMNSETKRGEIGFATSHTGLDWTYQQIVLREPFHLSYPYVFEWQGMCYMVPETLAANAVCLYRADEFPRRWSRVGRLIEGPCADPSIVRFGDLWWLFVCSKPYQHDTLRLYFAEELTGRWREHPQSPIIRGDKSCARPAGRIKLVDNSPVRFAQDCTPQYGTRVRAFDILDLTPNSYIEVENPASPVLQPNGNGWNAMGMHHIDLHLQGTDVWWACVDGFNSL